MPVEFTEEEQGAIQVASTLRGLGSSERTILRAMPQGGKDALLSALFKLLDAQKSQQTWPQGAAPTDQAETVKQQRKGKEGVTE